MNSESIVMEPFVYLYTFELLCYTYIYILYTVTLNTYNKCGKSTLKLLYSVVSCRCI